MDQLIARLRFIHESLTPLAEGFSPPDVSPNYTPYACSYHFFRGPDGRVISLDVIRSADTGNLGLRVVREREDGGIDGLSHITAQAEWAPFRTDGMLPSSTAISRPLLSRSGHAVAGSYFSGNTSSAIHSVRFSLSLQPLEYGVGIGQLGLRFAHLIATDFPRVRYRGFVELNGERLAIDSIGSISLHSGDRLPQYAYLISVPRSESDSSPSLLLAAVQDDALRILGEALGSHSVVYALGRNGLPKVALHVGAFGPDIPLGVHGRIVLRDVRPFGHDFLGQPTVTAAVSATYIPMHGAPIDLGRVFIDYRGARYVKLLQPDAVESQRTST